MLKNKKSTDSATAIRPMTMAGKAVLMMFAFVLLTSVTNLQAQSNKLWLTGGQNQHNTRCAQAENKISPENAGSLTTKWVFTTSGDVSTNPAVDGSHLYFPDWSGKLYKVNINTGLEVWSHPLSYWTGVPGDFARATPAIAGNTLIIGTQLSFASPATFDGAHVIGINKVTGELQWKTKVEDFFGAIITQAAVVHGDRAYVGVASMEEAFAGDPFYPCCVFRGSVVCLDVNTGAILWKTYMTPDEEGFSGCAVWGSTPVIDTKRNSVYVATGNNYTVSQGVYDCVAAGGTPDEVRACIMAQPGSPENYFDAIVSMDLNTGAVKWANTVVPYDAWTAACFFEGPNCPDDAGPDYDFGQGPALFTVGQGANKQELLGAGQKSGVYWALNPDNGAIVWNTQVGPGGTLGGLQWGSAVDGERIYAAISNNYYIPHLMTTGPGSGNTVKGGFWSALDAETGTRLWETPSVTPPAIPDIYTPADAVAFNPGAVSVANGVVFAGSLDAVGTMYAFNAATGATLWSFASGGSVNSGAAISNGKVFWGSGYSNFGLGTPNNKMYCFEVGEERPEATNRTIGQFALDQNQPNPFSGPTVINFEIPEAENVTLVVYDMLGVEMTRLVDASLPAGKHSATWNATSMPAGTYFCRLIAGKASATKTLTLVK